METIFAAIRNPVNHPIIHEQNRPEVTIVPQESVVLIPGVTGVKEAIKQWSVGATEKGLIPLSDTSYWNNERIKAGGKSLYSQRRRLGMLFETIGEAEFNRRYVTGRSWEHKQDWPINKVLELIRGKFIFNRKGENEQPRQRRRAAYR